MWKTFTKTLLKCGKLTTIIVLTASISMSNIEFYYNDLWSRTLQSIYNTKQIPDEVFDLYFNGSKLINISKKAQR